MTKRWAGMVLFLAICLLFLILNRGAYRGFFGDDELDNISWAPLTPRQVYLDALLTPKFLVNNFRPVGHSYFALGGRAFGLNFAPYVAVLHALHLLTALVLLLLARELKIAWHGALLATAFFALNVAIFDAVWKPMYVFDVLCGLWCATSILFYVQRRWVLSFLCFWLAYKSKELAVMLPVVLVLYEVLLGSRRWPRLLPFLAVSLSFGVQGLLFNPNHNNDYSFHFTWRALRATVSFYSSRLLLLPYAGLVFLALPWLTRDRRVWWGIAASGVFFVPLLFLPGRLFGAYCYMPLTVLALAAGAFAARFHPVWTLAVLAVWLPWNIHVLRIDRRTKLAADDEARAFVLPIQDFARTHPDPPAFILENAPPHLAGWGVNGAFKIAYHRVGLEPVYVDSPKAASLWGTPLAYLYWDGPHRHLRIFDHAEPEALPAYLEMRDSLDHRALLDGWFSLNEGFRWSSPAAAARLRQPAAPSRFQLRVNVPDAQIRANQHAHVAVRMNGAQLGDADFTTPGPHTVSWNAPPGAGDARIDLTVDPPYKVADSRPYGLAVVALGFIAPPKNGAP